MISIDNHFHYTPLFCEENIWKLLQKVYTNHSSLRRIMPIDVLFIINPDNSVALFNQKKSHTGRPVIWDYHVILSAQIDDHIVIFDFDSRCPLPATIGDYFKSTFPTDVQLIDNYRPYLRIIKADDYYDSFTSDRSHMHGMIAEDAYPDYAIISAVNSTNPLDLQRLIKFQTVIDATQVLQPYQYLHDILDLYSKND